MGREVVDLKRQERFGEKIYDTWSREDVTRQRHGCWNQSR